MSEYHRVEEVRVENDWIFLKVDGKRVEAPLITLSLALSQASDRAKKNFEVSPSGYGIYWPLIDEDISIDGLLGVAHMPQQQRKSA